jgi:hypothetical protein
MDGCLPGLFAVYRGKPKYKNPSDAGIAEKGGCN